MILSHVTYGIGSPSVEEGVQVSCEKKKTTQIEYVIFLFAAL